MGSAFHSQKMMPGYGIKQIEPKLSAISKEDYWSFLRKYTQGNAENTPSR